MGSDGLENLADTAPAYTNKPNVGHLKKVLTTLGFFVYDSLTGTHHGAQDMKIAEFNAEKFLKKIATFNRKAKKLQLPEVKAVKIGSELVEQKHKDDEGNVETYFIQVDEYDIQGEIPRVGGWAIHSKVQPAEQEAGNFVYTNKGFEPRESLRTVGMVCQHCNMARRRGTVYLLQNSETGEEKLVGKSCLKDFLPELNILEVLAYLEGIEKLSSEGNVYCDEDGEPIDGGWPRSAWVYPTWDLVAESLVLIRKWGFVSKAAARDSFDTTATADLLGRTGKARKDLYSDAEIEAVRDQVEQCIEWITTQDAKSDFFYNLQLAFKQKGAGYKMFSFVAAGVFQWIKHLGELEAKKNTNKRNEFVGEIGERRVFADVKIVREYVSEGQWGSTFITTLEMVDGQSLVWFASKRVGEIGETMTIKATIKEHKMYNDLHQTVITRGAKI
jgi:hypothetical protein